MKHKEINNNKLGKASDCIIGNLTKYNISLKDLVGTGD